jgi:transposase
MNEKPDILELSLCPRCESAKFWLLSTGQRRCSRCGLTRKFDRKIWEATRISPYWKGRLAELFCFGVPAYRLRFQVPLDIKTVQRWFRIMREAIYVHELEDAPAKYSPIEGELNRPDPAPRPGMKQSEPYLVCGIRQEEGKIRTFPVNRETHGNSPLFLLTEDGTGNLRFTDDCHAYIFLNIRGNHVVVTKDRGKSLARDHVSGIEGFWSFARHWLQHYRIVPQRSFHLYLKEIEWRYNNRDANLVPLLRKILSKRVIRKSFYRF